MTKTYNTPGVYIEEKPSIPPSVGRSATAIPVFIGHTERTVKGAESKPIRVSNLVDYESKFGGIYKGDLDQFSIELKKSLQSAPQVAQPAGVAAEDKPEIEHGYIPTKYLLYYQLQMFFKNGGGACYIISVGNYNDVINKDKYLKALELLEKEEEPTLILCTDIVNLNLDDCNEVYKSALNLCEKRKTLFTIIDVKYKKPQNNINDITQEFKEKIGTQNLKYGAAYFPYLKTTISFPVEGLTKDYALVINNVSVLEYKGVSAPSLEVVKIDVDSIKKEIESRATIAKHSLDAFKAINDAVKGKQTIGEVESEVTKAKEKFENDILSTQLNIRSEVKPKVDEFVKKIKEEKAKAQARIEKAKAQAPTTEQTQVLTDQDEVQVSTDENEAKTLIGFIKESFDIQKAAFDELNKQVQPAPTSSISIDLETKVITFNALNDSELTLGKFVDIFKADKDKLIPKDFILKLPKNDKGEIKLNDAQEKIKLIIGSYPFTVQYDPRMGEIERKLKEIRVVLPPSGAIAGVYASVDNDRGVWKAPANVSLNGVIEPVETISDESQERLNIDNVTGKSINAIRNFVGQGTLVWGARTLAGTSNEWRYISVRRLFNSIESDIRRGIRFAVFEPNDEMTWLKIKTMVSNYLNDLWRQGAFAGDTPAAAYFVNVGRDTMTNEEILEGKMIIKVGVAAVRPAEFVILQFTQKLQDS